MKIIISGANKLTDEIIKNIDDGINEITVISGDKKVLDEISEKYKIRAVFGNSADTELLTKEGISYTDLVVCVYQSDEKNILTSLVAKQLGARRVICRIDDFLVSKSNNFYQKVFGIDFVLNPDKNVAEEIFKRLTFSGISGIDTFLDEKIYMCELNVNDTPVLNNITIRDCRKVFNANVLVYMVNRDGNIFIPQGDFVLCSTDKIGIISSYEEMVKCFTNIKKIKKEVKNVTIIGASRIANFLIGLLNNSGIKIRLIESDKEKCREILHHFDYVDVINTSETDIEFFGENIAKDTDAVVALTSKDETNLAVYLLAKTRGIDNIVTYISKEDFMPLLYEANITNLISDSSVVVNQVLGQISALESIYDKDNMSDKLLTKSHYKIDNLRIRSFEFAVSKKFKYKNILFSSKEFSLKPNVLIVSIVRDGKSIFPDGNTSLQPDDKVTVLTYEKYGFKKIEDIFDQI